MCGMQVPWFTALSLAAVRFSAISSIRAEDGPESNRAHTSDPSDLVTDGTIHAMRTAYHVRPENKVTIPYAWALQHVNPKWKFNKEDWKSHEYDWSSIKDLDTWRAAVEADVQTDMTKWNDKIWLLNWFRRNHLKGPEVVWSKYADSTWHSQQPLRWADPMFGTSKPMETQQAYIGGKFTGFNWPGIRDLDSNYASKIQALKAAPSQLMGNLSEFCGKGVGRNGRNLGDFVIKASHLSESQGVFVVKAGKLVKPVRYDFIEKIQFPVKDFRTSDGLEYSKDPETMLSEISQMEKKSNVKTTTIFKAFPNVKKLIAQFGKTKDVCANAQTRAEVHIVMEFQEMIFCSWESARDKVIPRGIVIEKVRQYDLEIKVATGLGLAWGYYYNSFADSKQRLTDDGKRQAYALAEATAIKAGVDFCRVDIIIGEEGLIVSELTLVPAFNTVTKQPVKKHVKKLIDWHKYNQQTGLALFTGAQQI